MTWDFSTDAQWQHQLDWIRGFVSDEILPLEALDLDHQTVLKAVRPLQRKVKERGLWAAHLGPELGGHGYGQVKLALMNEILGGCELSALVFGNQPPDSGNMELLAQAGSAEQKERWLRPLLEGTILSSFSMTELGTGSDPRQFRTSARLEDGEWAISGSKWCVANADRTAFHILMCVTDPDAPASSRQSLIIVPADAPGVEATPIGMIDDPDSKGSLHRYAEVRYRDVRVPAGNLLGERGQAFALAQARNGPGRLHHFMRWIGIARRAFDDMCERAVSIRLHGEPLADKQFVQNFIAESAAELESARLLGLHTAWKLDQDPAGDHRIDIAMLKFHGAKIMYNCIDRAIQVYGSVGVSTTMPLAHLYGYARTARIYDGPDELHKATAARLIARRYSPASVPTDHIPTRRALALKQYAHLFDTVSVQ